MNRIAIFALASAMGLAAGAAEIGGMQVTFVQDGEVCGSFVNRSTYYKPWDVDGSVRLRLPSAEWNSGLSFTSEEGVDLSRGRYLALDVENLSATRQMRLTMHVAAGGVVTDSDDHAAAVLAQNRSVNTGIALNPGEKGTMMLLLPHAEIYHYPDGARGVYSIDTHHVTEIAVKMQWPYEQEFNYVADCRLSNLRLVQMPRRERAVDPDKYLP